MCSKQSLNIEETINNSFFIQLKLNSDFFILNLTFVQEVPVVNFQCIAKYSVIGIPSSHLDSLIKDTAPKNKCPIYVHI